MKINAKISGVGAWGPGFSDFQSLSTVFKEGLPEPLDVQAPKPELIPARERRRAPLMVKLGVEVANQACINAQINPADTQCVFSSGIGDAETTDYMCRVLAGPDKLLSPTKFHNSVHNAAAGYWSISTGCTRPATFVGGMHNSFSMSLVESLMQIQNEQTPVLLVMSDLPVPGPMWDMHSINDAFGAAFVIEPVAWISDQKPDTEKHLDSGKLPGVAARSRQMSFSVEPRADVQPAREKLPSADHDWPDLRLSGLPATDARLRALYRSSPSAKALSLLELLSFEKRTSIELPVSDGLNAVLEVAAVQEPVMAMYV